MRLGPLNPEYSHNRSYRELYVVTADGAAERAKLVITGQCRDYRCGAGLSAYLDVNVGDVVVAVEHSSHAGDESLKFLAIQSAGAVELVMARYHRDPEALRTLRVLYNAHIMRVSADNVAAQILDLDADLAAPAGW